MARKQNDDDANYTKGIYEHNCQGDKAIHERDSASSMQEPGDERIQHTVEVNEHQAIEQQHTRKLAILLSLTTDLVLLRGRVFHH